MYALLYFQKSRSGSVKLTSTKIAISSMVKMKLVSIILVLFCCLQYCHVALIFLKMYCVESQTINPMI